MSYGVKRDRMNDVDDRITPSPKRQVFQSSFSDAPEFRPENSSPNGASHVAQEMHTAGEEMPANILFITVYQPTYPIDVKVIHQICSQHGRVDKIVIFRKFGVQAYVQFASIEEAQRAKGELHDCDIYSGCCTLKVVFARPSVSELRVPFNGNDSWDYTIPNQQTAPAKKPPLLPLPPTPLPPNPPQSYPYPSGPTHYGGYPRSEPPVEYRNPPSQYPGPYVGYPSSASTGPLYGHRHPQQAPFNSYKPAPKAHPFSGADAGKAMGVNPLLNGCPGAVMIVHGLDPRRMNCQKLFNLFCQYGNVLKVKFAGKEGSAFIAMGDRESCDKAIKNMAGSVLYGQRLVVGMSKHEAIIDAPNPPNLPDGTPTFMDFRGSRLQRFLTVQKATRNRIFPVSNSLYFFNAPVGITEDILKQVFIDIDTKPPVRIRLFPQLNSKSSTGLLDWDTKEECIEALAVANHSVLSNPDGEYPFYLKLSFSK